MGEMDQTGKKKRIIAIICNCILVIFEIIGLWLCMNDGGVYNFIYFTVLSNVITMIVSAIYLIVCFVNGIYTENLPKWLRWIRYMATNCLALTFIIVITVLIPMGAKDGLIDDLLIRGPQLFHHILCPIISFLSFCIVEEGNITKRDIWIATFPTILYAIILTFLNVIKVVEGPYPFLLVYDQPFYLSVIWFILIVGISFGLPLVIRRVSQINFFKNRKNTHDDNINLEEINTQ